VKILGFELTSLPQKPGNIILNNKGGEFYLHLINILVSIIKNGLQPQVNLQRKRR